MPSQAEPGDVGQGVHRAGNRAQEPRGLGVQPAHGGDSGLELRGRGEVAHGRGRDQAGARGPVGTRTPPDAPPPLVSTRAGWTGPAAAARPGSGSVWCMAPHPPPAFADLVSLPTKDLRDHRRIEVGGGSPGSAQNSGWHPWWRGGQRVVARRCRRQGGSSTTGGEVEVRMSARSSSSFHTAAPTGPGGPRRRPASRRGNVGGAGPAPGLGPILSLIRHRTRGSPPLLFSLRVAG
jgi:hypothetical protein